MEAGISVIQGAVEISSRTVFSQVFGESRLNLKFVFRIGYVPGVRKVAAEATAMLFHSCNSAVHLGWREIWSQGLRFHWCVLKVGRVKGRVKGRVNIDSFFLDREPALVFQEIVAIDKLYQFLLC